MAGERLSAVKLPLGLAVKQGAEHTTLRVGLDAVEDTVIGDRGLVDPPRLQNLDLREAGQVGPWSPATC